MKKDYISTQKYLILTPRKMREVVFMIKKLSPVKALEKLMFIPKRSAAFLAKVIKTALAQAKLAGESEDNLIFKEILIGDGPSLKRGRAASRGRWHPYKKRMSHVRVVLTTKGAVKKVEKKVEKTEEIKPALESKTVKAKVVKTAKKAVSKKKENGTKS